MKDPDDKDLPFSFPIKDHMALAFEPHDFLPKSLDRLPRSGKMVKDLQVR
jgi:hypothetical protein